MIKAVLDTSVLGAAFLKRGGVNHKVLQKAGSHYRLYLCEAILEELERILQYPRIRKRYPYSNEDIEEFIDVLRSVAERVYRRCPRVRVIEEDPADNVILACGLEAKADYIVSKDHHLQALGEFRGMKIVTTDRFLEILGG